LILVITFSHEQKNRLLLYVLTGHLEFKFMLGVWTMFFFSFILYFVKTCDDPLAPIKTTR
jgi:hypothetical protein